MQAKDIPDWPVLLYLYALDGVWATHFPPIDGGVPSVQRAMAPLRGIEEHAAMKLALAKMRALMRRGLVNGCACGCRGDWTITEKGAEEAAATLVAMGAL